MSIVSKSIFDELARHSKFTKVFLGNNMYVRERRQRAFSVLLPYHLNSTNIIIKRKIFIS